MNVSGGTEPYTYEWSDGSKESAITQAAAGNYSVVVHDAAGKKYSNTFHINQPEVMSILATVKDETATGTSDGQIEMQVIGGMQPFTYYWNDGINSKERTNLSHGIYEVAIKDGNGCMMNHQVLISVNDAMYPSVMLRSANNNLNDDNITVYPNPFSNSFTVRFRGKIGELQSIKMFSVDGKEIQNVELMIAAIDANEIAVNTKEILPGNYLLKVYTTKNTYSRLLTRVR